MLPDAVHLLRLPRLSLCLRILSCFILLNFSFPYAEESKTTEIVTETTQLNDIKMNITLVKKKKNELELSLNKLTDPAEKESVSKNIDRLNNQLSEYQTLFNRIALGGLDTGIFNTPPESEDLMASYNWKKELLQIIQPIFTEMQRMTDVPRKRELLRNENKIIDEQITALTKGLEYTRSFSGTNLSKESASELKTIQSTWQDKLNELQHQQKIVQLKLQDLTEKRPIVKKIRNSAWNFIKGRGLILMLAFLAFSGLLSLFSFLGTWVEKHQQKKKQGITTSFHWRVLFLIYQIFSLLISITTLLVILHSSGDMVLFGLAILILFAMILSLRSTLPDYFKKLRLFLNAGQAREGERIIYQNLPWKISKISLYSVYLTNPALDNGTIRLTTDILNSMLSRPVKMDEIWFPTMPGDSVILKDGRLAKVQRQTPEAVYLICNNSDLIYDSSEFFKDKITNITYGYGVSVTFTLSHEHFSLDTDEVTSLLTQGIKAQIIDKEPDLAKALKSFRVDFQTINEAAHMVFSIYYALGANAVSYYSLLPKLTQKACVKTAQEQNWIMPYSSIVLSHK